MSADTLHPADIPHPADTRHPADTQRSAGKQRPIAARRRSEGPFGILYIYHTVSPGYRRFKSLVQGIGVHHGEKRPGIQRPADKIGAVEPLTAKGKKDIARLERTGIGRYPRDLTVELLAGKSTGIDVEAFEKPSHGVPFHTFVLRN